MFDSLINFRRENASLLRTQIKDNVVAHSLLFSGPPFSGKMSLAIETARSLSCLEDRSDTCMCSSCQSFRYMSVPHVIILSHRDHEVRIKAAISLFEEMQSERSKRLLISQIRIALMAYHEAFAEKQDTKNSALFVLAHDIDTLLIDFETLPIEKSGKIIQELKKALFPLLQAKGPSVSIDNIRGSAAWTSKTGLVQQKRFIILEDIENSTLGANNSLLKLLEEPPADTYIFLLSSHPKRLLPTILSRVQHHQLKAMTKDEKKALFQEVFFCDESHYASIEDYVYIKGGIPLHELEKGAKEIVRSISTLIPLDSSLVSTIFGAVDSSFALTYFLMKIQEELKDYLMMKKMSVLRIRKIEESLRDATQKARVYNQQNSVFLETLYYRLVSNT